MQYETADAKKVNILLMTKPGELEGLRKFWKLRIQRNDAKYQEALKLWTVMVNSAVEIYGKNSAVHKYIYSHKVPKPPNINAEYEKVLKKVKN